MASTHADYCEMDLDHDGECGTVEEGDGMEAGVKTEGEFVIRPSTPVVVQVTIQSSEDREIDAAALCIRALEPLDPVAKLRVVRWLTQRVEAMT